MPDNELAVVLAELETEIGAERLSALRREAARRRVSILTLISEAIVSFSEKLTTGAS